MVIFARLFGLYFFPHQSCTSSTLLLRKEIYPRKSFTNLYQLIFSCLLNIVFHAVTECAQPLENQYRLYREMVRNECPFHIRLPHNLEHWRSAESGIIDIVNGSLRFSPSVVSVVLIGLDG